MLVVDVGGVPVIATLRCDGPVAAERQYLTMRGRRTAALIIGAGALTMPAMTTSATARDADPWRQAEGHHGYLSADVVALSPTSAFFAGDFGARHRTRLKSWDGVAWSNEPGIARPRSELHAIDAAGRDDAWAVGEQRSRDGDETRSLLIHWDGTEWRVVRDGGLGHTEFTSLRDVSMAAPDDVWAAGYDYSSHGTHFKALILHWDGLRWNLVDAPTDASLGAVTALESGEVWISGYEGRTTEHVIEHWDGSSWTRTPTPGWIYSLDALSPNDVWAVGNNGSTLETLIEHWDAKAWTVVPSPNPGNTTYLSSVSAVSPDDVWAVGNTGWPGADVGDTVIEHWDGVKWTVVPSPSPGSHWNFLQDVSADSANDAWASGAFSNHRGEELAKTLLLHWDGTTWTRLHDVR